MSKTKSKPLHYGLYGENDFLLPDFMHCETIEYRTSLYNRTIKEHLHTSLYQIFIIESGKVNFTVQETCKIIRGPAIVTIPENTLHGLNAEKKIKGKVITLSTSFIENFFSASPKAFQELNAARIITEFSNKTSFSSTSFFAENLYKEINNDFPEKKMVLQCYFNLLLSLIYRLLKKSDEINSLNYRNHRYFRDFQKSVKQSCTPMKTLKQYASELGITSVHLNRICQSTVGKSALQVVHGFLVLEAEKILTTTDLNIAEVAYRLNFEDPAYFSRFFKKNTGASPKEFREKR